jgi:hypothetical protein
MTKQALPCAPTKVENPGDLMFGRPPTERQSPSTV